MLCPMQQREFKIFYFYLNIFRWTGAGQVCCYDFEGWLMHSDDYENAAHLRFFSPGTSHRAHPMGTYPFKRPPYVPSLSNFHTDLMAYEKCCKWAGHCEFYFWRRQTSGCIEYIPPVAGKLFYIFKVLLFKVLLTGIHILLRLMELVILFPAKVIMY